VLRNGAVAALRFHKCGAERHESLASRRHRVIGRADAFGKLFRILLRFFVMRRVLYFVCMVAPAPWVGCGGDSFTGGDGASAAGGSAGNGGSSAGSGTGGSSSGGKSCEDLLNDVRSKLAEAKVCCPLCAAARQCFGVVEGVCCSETVNAPDSPETASYRLAFEEYRAAGCTTPCPRIPCSIVPSNTCQPTGSCL
jgi:hypothetical protein